MSLMIFEWREDAEFGDFGWIPKGYPNFNIVPPGGFQHDCMEHFPRGIKHGPIADELLALGARLWMRVDSGWWGDQNFSRTPIEAWASDLQALHHDMQFREVSPPPGLPAFEFDDLMEDEIQEIMPCALKMINEEIMERLELAQDEGQHLYTLESPLFKNMANWLRLGVKATQARYRGRNSYDVMNLGELLDDEAKRYKHGEEGDLLYVRVHEKDMEFSIRHTSVYGLY